MAPCEVQVAGDHTQVEGAGAQIWDSSVCVEPENKNKSACSEVSCTFE